MFLVRIIEALAVASLFGMLAQDVPQQGDITLTVTVTANGDVTLNAFWFSADPIPGNIEKAVRDNFPCNWRDVHAGERYFAGTCKRLLKSDGTVVGDTLRLAGLTSALQAETGVKHLNVAVFIRGELGDTKDEPKVDSRWTVYRDDKRRSGASYSFRTDTGEPPPDLPVRAGHKFQPDRLIVPLVVVLSLPVLTAILLTKGRAGRPAGGRLVWLSWINLGTFIYWISAASLSDLAAFCSRIAPDQQWLVAIAGVLFFSLPLLIAVFLCLLVSHPPAEKGELAAALKRNMTAQALSFVPVSFIIVGAFMFARSRPVAGATMIGAFLSYRALAWAASHWTYSRIRLLSGGELRDRVSALAAKAGVRVPNLYLLRSLVPREVNAYAMSGGNVMLTESMLRALPRREVDAVMAHEIGHLRGRHIAAKTVVLWAAILLSGPLMGFMVTRLHLPEWIWHVPIFAIGITFLMARISQRNEFSADAQAAQLTGDPEAKIAALARLTKLTQSPVDWGGMQGSILSHPSMRARVLALGRRFNVPDERALAILENPDLIGGGSYELENLEAAVSAAPDSPARRTYALPAELASGDPLFNTGAKQRCLVSALWTIEILVVLLPLALSYGIRALPYGPKKNFLLFLAGLVFCFLITLGTEQWMWKNFYRRMKAALAQRLKNTNPAALFVGLCPGPETMRLEGFPDWDLGFLTLEGGRLIYLGERISFSLDPGSVIDIRTIQGPLYWVRDYRVLIRWTQGSFSLRLPESFDSQGQAGKLRKMLDTWRLSSTPALGQAEASALPGPPVLPRITEAAVSRWKILIRVVTRAGKVLAGSLILNMFLRSPAAFSEYESDQIAWTILSYLASVFAAPLLFLALALPVFLRKPRPQTDPPSPKPQAPPAPTAEPISTSSSADIVAW